MRPFIKYPLYALLALAMVYLLNDVFRAAKTYQHSLISTPAERLSPRYIHLGDQVPVTILHPGQFFWTHVDNKRTETCSGHVAYRIISKHMDDDKTHTLIWYNFPDTEVSTPPGFYVNDTLLWIPEWLPEGEYLLERLATWVCQTDTRIVQTPIGHMSFMVVYPVDTTEHIDRPTD